jgi:hypothetical protein
LTHGLNLQSYTNGINSSPNKTHANGDPLLDVKTSGPKIKVDHLKSEALRCGLNGFFGFLCSHLVSFGKC